jgi:protein phosphatase 2C family protein 2/3
VAFDLRIPVYADDSSDEDMDEESEDGQGLFGQQLNEGPLSGKGKGKEVLGKGKGKEVAHDAEHDEYMDASIEEYESEEEEGEDPLPPGFTNTRLTSVGRPLVATHPELSASGPDARVKPEKQLEHMPEGDEPSAAVRVEGLMDVSEDPIRTEA